MSKEKITTGMLVYKVIDGHCLFGNGTFFLNKDEGYEYQEKMNEMYKENGLYYTNQIIKYVNGGNT